MPRAGLSPDAVVDLAVDHVDDHGPAALTLAAVAARAGVATPSLYKHVGSLAELRSLVSLRGWQELTERIADAVIGRSGEEALRGLLPAYRSYVVQHPNRYRAMHQAPLSTPGRPPSVTGSGGSCWPCLAALGWRDMRLSTRPAACARPPTALPSWRPLAGSASPTTSTPATSGSST